MAIGRKKASHAVNKGNELQSDKLTKKFKAKRKNILSDSDDLPLKKFKSTSDEKKKNVKKVHFQDDIEAAEIVSPSKKKSVKLYEKKPNIKKTAENAFGAHKSFKDKKLKTLKKKEGLVKDAKSTKELKVLRKSQKSNYELAQKAKKLWEVVRCNETRKGKCDILCKELHNLIKGKANQLIYAHDTSRVIECLMIVGTEDIRNELFDELQGEIIKMSQSKYAKFFVMKLLKYGNKAQKEFVISSFYKNVVKLLKHSEAASVIECAYNEFANASQRFALSEEFYGDIYRLFKDQQIKSLSEVITANPEKKDSILSHVKENLMLMIQKSVIRHSIVHHVLNEYLTHCNLDDKKEIIEALRESVVHILHTKDGSRVAMQCVWHGSAKDRKTIIKSFKTHVVKICKEEHGHLVLLAIFDSVDDTLIVNKFILSEILKSIKEIATDSHGRKVIMHLLSPRDTVHCHPDIIKILELGDNNATSKKDAKVRHRELLEKISPYMLQFLEENVKEMIFTASSSIVAQCILKHATGNFSKVYSEIADMVMEPFTKEIVGNNNHVIEHTAGHLFLKHFIKLDKERTLNGQETFSEYLISRNPKEAFKSWTICNRGLFILVGLFETENNHVMEFLEDVLLPLRKQLKTRNLKGAEVLLKKLELSA